MNLKLCTLSLCLFLCLLNSFFSVLWLQFPSILNPVLESVDAVACTCEQTLMEMAKNTPTSEQYSILEVWTQTRAPSKYSITTYTLLLMAKSSSDTNMLFECGVELEPTSYLDDVLIIFRSPSMPRCSHININHLEKMNTNFLIGWQGGY